ncbi:MAG: hypothetical protein PVG15_17015 [Desulfobacterales bacterium]|jgi:hypothetical protein
MYLARKKIKGVTHYYIRESYPDGDTFLSRDLIDLGTEPAKYIIYPGGNAFYIDAAVEAHLDKLGVTLQGTELEDIFWRFLDPDIQHALAYFRHREKRSQKENKSKEKLENAKLYVHIFDRRRLHYLKFGRMEQGYLWLIPQKFFDILRNKSRDEIEQQFLDMEQQLNPREYKAYAYVIFNINQFFTESFAKKRPQDLKQGDVDEHFIDEICKLNQDQAFWAGMQTTASLHVYLIRYLLMYFDYDFAPRSWVEDYLRNFINSRRDYQSLFKAGSVTLKQASSIFGESRETLKKMTRQELVRLFRRKAQEFHPDKGGNHEKFVDLTHAYHVLLSTKK